MNCKNCNTEIDYNFCPNCGQPKNLKRIDKQYIMHEIEHVLHFERGILHTVKELFTNPGKNIRKYLTESRTRLVKPVIFIFLTSLLYSLINNFFHIEDAYVNNNVFDNSVIIKIINWMQSHYGYANLLTGIFIAMWLKILFKKYDYNFYELLIMLCFVMGISMIIFSVFALIEGLVHFKLLGFASIISFLYLILSIVSFFNDKKIGNYFKAIIAFLFGSITFYIIIIAIGATLDFF
jgi:hypothetical protein